MTDWVRTKGGAKIHRPTCHLVNGPASSAVPWHWAEDAENDLALLDKIGSDWDRSWNRFCYFCCMTGHFEQKRMLAHAIEGNRKP